MFRSAVISLALATSASAFVAPRGTVRTSSVVGVALEDMVGVSNEAFANNKVQGAALLSLLFGVFAPCAVEILPRVRWRRCGTLCRWVLFLPRLTESTAP